MRSGVLVLVGVLGCGSTTGSTTTGSTLPIADNQCLDDTAHGRHAEPDPAQAASGKPAPVAVAVELVEARRLSGEKHVLPDDATKDAIRDRGVTGTTALFRLCLDVSGVPSEVTRQRSSCFPRYDERIRTAMLAWRFSPYEVDGHATEVCTSVNFVYSQR